MRLPGISARLEVSPVDAVVRSVTFPPKVGQIGIEWDESGTFKVIFQYILALMA